MDISRCASATGTGSNSNRPGQGRDIVPFGIARLMIPRRPCRGAPRMGFESGGWRTPANLHNASSVPIRAK